MAAEFFHTITTDDIGKLNIGQKRCHECGHNLSFDASAYIPDFMGRIMPQDIGKRIYRVRDDADARWVYQVENDAQLAIRQGIQVQKIQAS